MASMQSWRKAYGAIKDTTTVSLANLNSDFKVPLDSVSSPFRFPRIFLRPKFGQVIQTLVSSEPVEFWFAGAASDLWVLIGACSLL
jgi:hypothetical protein